MLRSAVLLAAAGWLQAVSLACPEWAALPGLNPGQTMGWLQCLALALAGAQMLHSIEQASDHAGRALLLKIWWFATCWLCATLGWLFISMHRYGGLSAGLAASAVLALCAALALLYALPWAAVSRWRTWVRKPWLWPVGFAGLWTLGELLRGQLLTGLPWGAVGYAHVDSALSGWAPWVGVYGVGWLAACVAASWGQCFWRPGRKHLQVALVVTMLAVGSAALLRGFAEGQTAMAARAPVSITLLQGNIPQDEKFVRGRGVDLALDWYATQIAQARTALVLAPETAVPLLPEELDPTYWDRWLQAPVVRQGGAVMTGIPLGNPREGYSNSVAVIDGHLQSGASDASSTTRFAYRYDKHHLVPFGEFIPPMFRWFTDLMHIPLGDFNRGSVAPTSWVFQGLRWAPNICFEDLFGEELALRFSDESTAPDVLVNFSNIGWFGDSAAVPQHLNISRMRSLELSRPMVRVTNTGATAIIDAAGRVVDRLPSHLRAALVTQVSPGPTSITPYARWVSGWGLWALWAFCLGTLWMLLRTNQKVR